MWISALKFKVLIFLLLLSSFLLFLSLPFSLKKKKDRPIFENSFAGSVRYLLPVQKAEFKDAIPALHPIVHDNLLNQNPERSLSYLS